MSKEKVLITGGLGNVGQWVVKETLLRSYTVYVYDIEGEKTRKKYETMRKTLDFNMIWGNLTDKAHVEKTIADLKPEYIIHVAAIIAPTAYIIPELAYKVNVLGTQYLINAASTLKNFKRFVFVSSYSVHGSRNPYKSKDKLTGDSAVNPKDNYGRHKIAGEEMLEKSTIDWTIVRLPAVFTLDKDFGSSPEFLRFAFMLDPERNEHAIDARDAGLGISMAIEAKTSKMKLDIGGDPKQGWSGKAKDLQNPLFESKGLSPFPDQVYRRSDPSVDSSWYFEDFIDTTKSQDLLNYQRISFQSHIAFNKKQMGIARYFLKLIGPLVKNKLVKSSDFKDINEIQSDDIWETIKEKFNMDENPELMVN